MNKRHFMMLAHNVQDFKGFIGGWLASIKRDGQRAFWDGGVSRGIPAKQVPWANTAKDGRLLQEPISTGLWSRYGKVIHAPDWWLDMLPDSSLDGELYMERGMHQELRKCVADHEPGDWWQIVKFHVFDAPSYQQVFEDGLIDEPNFPRKIIEWKKISEWLVKQGIDESSFKTWPLTFDFIYEKLQKVQNKVVVAEPQIKLPLKEADARAKLDEMALAETDQGGEGLILRRPTSVWEPKRSKGMLKVKPRHDAEAEVMGFTWGRKTDRGSKLLGKVGALIVKFDLNGKEFQLSGFTDEERRVKMREGVSITPSVNREPLDREGQQASDKWEPVHFPMGTKVTFSYRELTDDGIPKEAEYKRVRLPE